MQCKEIMKIEIFILQFRSYYSKTTVSMLQPNNRRNSGVLLRNYYTLTKFERVLSDISRDIHQFINLSITRK